MSFSKYNLLRGQRADLRRQLKTLEVRADNHMITVNQKIDPLFDFMEIEIEHAKQAIISLEVIINEAKSIHKKIEKINDQIGHE